jgi:hypothetical protein
MALTRLQLKTVSQDDSFRDRVAAALTLACIAIAVDAPATVTDTLRDRAARRLLEDMDLGIEKFAFPVALGFENKSQPDLSDATDVDIDNRVSAIFNDLMLKG